MTVQPIEKIRKRFPKEWLLIEVFKTDEATTTSISGRIIAHSPVRDTIYKKLMQVKSRRHPILIDYSQDKLPEGMAVAFSLYA